MNDLADSIVRLRDAMASLRGMALPPLDWIDVARALDTALHALAKGDDNGVEQTSVALSNAVFRAKVLVTLGNGRQQAPAVAPTKQTAALPLIGVACGLLLLGLGFALGGGVVLAGTATLALFVVGVAVAGSTSVNQRRSRSHTSETETSLTGAPPSVIDALDQLSELLTEPEPSPGE
jgi:hypothetical protein